MFSVMDCAVLDGFGAKNIRVEVDISRGLPSFCVVGLAENSVKEARVRVQAAIKNAGFDFPSARISVNLSPADVQKRGTTFDLTIALGILKAAGIIPPKNLQGIAAIGELSLTGEVMPVRGMLALAETTKKQGFNTLVVCKQNAAEAALIEGLTIRIVNNFGELVKALLSNTTQNLALGQVQPESEVLEDFHSDMADVCGQEEAKRALLISVAGNHNVLLIGGPGSGKSMMAARLPTIAPPLTYQEAVELTKIYSIAGLTLAGDLIKKRPFRAPHHSTTRAGLAGGGSGNIRPGEISLASFGVLFLDELLEFPRAVLEVLRQPLESGEITLSRANQNVTFPAQISFAGALNPCPCGNFGQQKKVCICSQNAIVKYQSRLSGPLIDRIDIHVSVPPVNLELMNKTVNNETSKSMRERVIKARKVQSLRFGSNKTNGKMQRNDIKKFACLTDKAQSFLVTSAEKLNISARAYDRIIRVARTVADLDESSHVHPHHIGEAFHFRPASMLMKGAGLN